MIERFPNTKFISHPGRPTILFRERAILPCGCFVVVGERADNGEAATATVPHGPEHRPVMAAFHEAWHATLPSDSARPAIEVVDELLEATCAIAGD